MTVWYSLVHTFQLKKKKRQQHNQVTRVVWLKVCAMPKRTVLSFRVTDIAFAHPSVTAMQTNNIKWYSPEEDITWKEVRWGGGNLSLINKRHCLYIHRKAKAITNDRETKPKKQNSLLFQCLSTDYRQSLLDPPTPPPLPVWGVRAYLPMNVIGCWQPTNQIRQNPEHETFYLTFRLLLNESVLACSQTGAVAFCDSQPCRQVSQRRKTKQVHRQTSRWRVLAPKPVYIGKCFTSLWCGWGWRC